MSNLCVVSLTMWKEVEVPVTAREGVRSPGAGVHAVVATSSHLSSPAQFS